jgi:hypothetical protein
VAVRDEDRELARSDNKPVVAAFVPEGREPSTSQNSSSCQAQTAIVPDRKAPD